MSDPHALGPLEPPDPPAPEDDGEGPVGSVTGWARAILLGLRDTAREMLDEGRRGARQAQSEGWARFDAKTKHRRKARTED